MPERRNDRARASSGPMHVLGAFAAIGLWLLARAARRPVDSLAMLGAGAASVAIVVNALFLQSHWHSAPFVANPTSQPQTFESRLAPLVAAAPRSPESLQPRPAAGGTRPAPQPVSARRNDPIAELISSSIPPPSRVVAVQRVLSAFGYGQIIPSGILDGATSAAIKKFESDHKLPATGRLSDRLLGELGDMTGHPIE